jgi:DNA-binding NarL/FixJ family response regulator
MRVLYVLGGLGDTGTEAVSSLLAVEPDLRVETAVGAAAALVEVRARQGYQAVLLSPRLSANEGLALIATLRRDRVPVAIVAIIDEDQRTFFAQALTAGADDVAVLRSHGLDAPEDTLRRIRASRHLPLEAGQPRLRILYVGQDDLAFDLLADLAFATADRTSADEDGACSLSVGDSGERAQVVVVDEQPAEGHALRVVKWLQTHAPGIPIILLTSPTGHDVGGAALELGAADVVSKAGTYRRRLVAALAKQVAATPSRDAAPPAPAPESTHHDRDDARAAELAALKAEVENAHARLANQERLFAELRETLGFERAMRDRDRDEMARLRHSFTDERERRVVLEDTLRATEDRSTTHTDAIESRHAEVIERLERDLEQLQNELAARTSERDRLIQHDLFGWASVTADGVLVACNATFAKMFGYDDPADAIADAASGLPGLTDHAFLVEQLNEGKNVERVSSVLRRRDGRTFRVLTSAAYLATAEGDAPLIERMLIDLDDQSRLDEQLRLARRLEAAGRLTAEMAVEIETMLAGVDDPASAEEARRRASLLIKQLLAFARHQAKPAGMLSLIDAIRRAEPRLREIGGDLAPVTLDLEDAGPVAASEDDVEQLLSALAFATAGCLPYGGTLTFRTRSIREGFDQRTELSVTASGYGVTPVSISSSLTRLVTKCGGVVRSTDDPARSTTLHVYLPC